MARILTVSNQKGGVGKTTSTINVSACFAELGRTVLVIDLDPQGNCTSGLGIRREDVRGTIYDVLSQKKLSEKRKLEDVIKHTKWPGLDVAPSHVNLAAVELELANRLGRESVLKKALLPVQDRYDYIILDTPPSLSLLTVNALTAVDDVLVSMLAEPWSFDGTEKILATLQSVREDLNPDITLGGVIVIITDPELTVSGEIIGRLEANEQLRDQVFATKIPWNESLARSAGACAPVIHLDGSSEGARAYRLLAREILARLGDTRPEDLPEPAEAAEETARLRSGASPRSAPAAPSDPTQPATRSSAALAVMDAPDGPADVLVVDDLADSRKIIRELLNEGGYRTAVATGGAEALQMIHEHPVRVVVTDVHMPGIDGMELLERVHAEFPTMPVILYSGDPNPSLGIRAFARHAFYFLEKPVSSKQLLSIVGRAMKGDRADAAPAAEAVSKPVPPAAASAALKKRTQPEPLPAAKAAGGADVPRGQVHMNEKPQNIVAITTRVGYVNGPQGRLAYRGYDCIELAGKSTFEETTFLLVYGRLPNKGELDVFSARLRHYRRVPSEITAVLRTVPTGRTQPMTAMRTAVAALGAFDERVTQPMIETETEVAVKIIAQMATLTAMIARLRNGGEPLDPDPDLSHAGDFLYMLTGKRPDPVTERIMDISLILHADHGMNPATFASMMTDPSHSSMYSTLVAGLCSLNRRPNGGANEEALRMLDEMGGPDGVAAWVRKAKAEGRRVAGIGHRLYRTQDPRAHILRRLAGTMAEGHPRTRLAYDTAIQLEQELAAGASDESKPFANVHLYSGMIYRAMGIDPAMFTLVFAVARVVGWAARVLEYKAARERNVTLSTTYQGPVTAEYAVLEARSGA